MNPKRKSKVSWTKWAVVAVLTGFCLAFHLAGMDVCGCVMGGCAGAVVLM
jgi:hypothetical protein